eukprot:gene11146-3968_t
MKEPLDIHLKILKRSEEDLKFEIILQEYFENNDIISVDLWHDLFIEGRKKELVSFSKSIRIKTFDKVECEFYSTQFLKPILLSKHKVKIKY